MTTRHAIILLITLALSAISCTKNFSGEIWVSDSDPVVNQRVEFRAPSPANATEYTWDFGDFSTEPPSVYNSVDHAFSRSGSYHVTVTVSIDDGSRETYSIDIQVND